MSYSVTLLIIVSILNVYFYVNDPIFGEKEDLGLIEYDPITEASGIASSRKNENVLWTHNDSADKNRIYALNSKGTHLGVYYIDGVDARDWEDIAVGPGPVDGQQYIYIGDIGDNSEQYDLKFIYRILEPIVDFNQSPINTLLSGAETITFQYPDGNRDAETLMIDPLTKDIYVVSKSEDSVRVYRAPYPQSTTETITVEHGASLSLRGTDEYEQTVGGDISPSGLEILLKTYFTMYYWCRTPGQSLWQVFENKPIAVSYIPEPQGEAVCWAANEMGYYTISEEPLGIPAHLYFYPRLNNTLVVDSREIPLEFELEQNYPNPFNPATLIPYTLFLAAEVELTIYNIQGEKVKTLVNEFQTAGQKLIAWDGLDDLGVSVTSGLYFFQLRAGNFQNTKRMILTK